MARPRLFHASYFHLSIGVFGGDEKTFDGFRNIYMYILAYLSTSSWDPVSLCSHPAPPDALFQFCSVYCTLPPFDHPTPWSSPPDPDASLHLSLKHHSHEWLLFQWGLGQTVIAIVIVFILIIWILRKRDQNVHNVNILTIPILTQSTTVRQQSESKPDSLTLMVAMALITHLSLLARWGNNGWCFTVTCKSWMPSEVRVKRVTTTTEGK